MKIQTTLSRRAKITRVAIVTAVLVVVLVVGALVIRAVNATGSCQATYIDHTSKGGVTKAECAK